MVGFAQPWLVQHSTDGKHVYCLNLIFVIKTNFLGLNVNLGYILSSIATFKITCYSTNRTNHLLNHFVYRGFQDTYSSTSYLYKNLATHSIFSKCEIVIS